MPRIRRVALSLGLDWAYKRHTVVFAGAQRYAKEQGWETVIDEFVDQPARYDGVIARASKSLAERAIQRTAPLVNVWLNSPVKDLFSGVFPDYAASGRLRAEHLLDRGFRNFAVLTSREAAAKLESAEFHRLIREAGCACVAVKTPTHIAETHARWKETEALINDWMDQWQLPIGVHMHSDSMGRIVAPKCLERGWRVPENVGIVAGMNEESICEQLEPSLSSVEMGYERVGYQAAELLDRLMDKKRRSSKKKATRSDPSHILIPPQGLIVRESTDFYSVEDKLVAAALAFIAANSHRPISQDDVAAAASTGVRTLQIRFRETLDRPNATVIRQVRIDRAKRELTQTNKSMATIARDVGFSSAERLNEVFRRELGISPSQYRKQRCLENVMR